MRRDLALLCALGLAGCATSSPRFVPGPVVLEVDDRLDIDPPRASEFFRYEHHVDNFFVRQTAHVFDLRAPAPALDVNRLGEVVDSSWFTDRGVLGPEAVRAGAGAADPGPEAHFPWTVVHLKSGGANPGFVFEDARGVEHILKFDKVGAPDVSTAAGAIANRLFWALGYHVPDDRVVFFERSQLRIADGARAEGVDERAIDAVLTTFATSRGDGRYRALTSRFLEGVPLGGYSYAGTRSDDPNDTIDHRRRRSLRALRVFGAWLNHVDLKVDNTLDLYVERHGRRFVEHYLVDFDGCLGGFWSARREARVGWARDFDLAEFVVGLVTLGAPIRPYERLGAPPHPEIGLFESERFDPSRWKANYVNDHVLAAGPADRYWAGTLLARLDRRHLRAAVAAGRFADPGADSLLVEILEARRLRSLDWALRAVTPVGGLERIESLGTGLVVRAFDTLRELGRPSDLDFRALARDVEGRSLPANVGPGPEVEVRCGAAVDEVVVTWTARDGHGRELPPTEAHYHRIDGRWVLVGILRDGQ